jgi:hypothetical protein
MRPAAKALAGIVTAAAVIAALSLTGTALAQTTSAHPPRTGSATWTVKPGGAIKATAETTTITVSGNEFVACPAAQATAHLQSGTGLPSGLGTINSLTPSGCVGPLSYPFSVATQKTPWHLKAVSYNSTTKTTTATISGIFATLSGLMCTADLAGTSATAPGTVKVTYSNKTGKLKVLATGGTLHVWNVAGCYGMISSGDAVGLTGTFTVSPKQVITSP